MMFPDGFDIFALSRTKLGSLIILHDTCRCLVACKGGGGVGDLDVFGLFGVKNHPKKFPNVFGDIGGGIFMTFPDSFDAFWALQTPIRVLDHPALGQRCLVACKGGLGDLAVFGRFGVKHHPKAEFSNSFEDTLDGYL